MQLLILLVTIVGFIVIALILLRRQSSPTPPSELLEIVRMLQSSSEADRKILLQNLQDNTRSLNQRLDNAAQVMSNVQRNVGEMSEIGRSMKQLQEFLQSPKLRGNIGEQVLREVLVQMLPKSAFHLQYAFKSGEIVDAAIKTSAGIIPIDAKFPMENFRKMNSAQGETEKHTFQKLFYRDIKRHIDAISKKYILTDEGTIDYALMYVPSESVYYEVVNASELYDYSARRRVLPVSPSTFYAYMRAILMSFEGQKIEEQAKQILVVLRSVQTDYEKLDESLGTLNRHLTNASNMMGTVLSGFTQLGQKINSTRELPSKGKRSR